MRKFTMLFMFALVTLFSRAQDNCQANEIQTLFSNHNNIGYYGSFSVGYSEIDGLEALVTGGRAALIFNHKMALGLAGYGFFNNLDDYNHLYDGKASYYLTGAYGGVLIEPIIGGLKLVHVTFPLLIGVGGVAARKHYILENGEIPYTIDYPEHDVFFVIKPAVELEVNIIRFFRIAATLSYRIAPHFDLVSVDNDALEGLQFSFNFKFGKF